MERINYLSISNDYYGDQPTFLEVFKRSGDVYFRILNYETYEFQEVRISSKSKLKELRAIMDSFLKEEL